MMLLEHAITVGLHDRETKTQKISTDAARLVIENLIVDANMCATIFTQGVYGIYKHDDGSIVREPSIRIEIAGESKEDIEPIIRSIKKALNQETIMWKCEEVHVAFYGDTSTAADI